MAKREVLAEPLEEADPTSRMAASPLSPLEKLFNPKTSPPQVWLLDFWQRSKLPWQGIFLPKQPSFLHPREHIFLKSGICPRLHAAQCCPTAAGHAGAQLRATHFRNAENVPINSQPPRLATEAGRRRVATSGRRELHISHEEEPSANKSKDVQLLAAKRSRMRPMACVSPHF